MGIVTCNFTLIVLIPSLASNKSTDIDLQIIQSFQTHRLEQTVQTRTVCHLICLCCSSQVNFVKSFKVIRTIRKLHKCQVLVDKSVPSFASRGSAE